MSTNMTNEHAGVMIIDQSVNSKEASLGASLWIDMAMSVNKLPWEEYKYR